MSMSPLEQWEQAHPAAARALWSLLTPTSPAPPGAGSEQGAVRSEAYVQSAVRLEAARKGYFLTRNNKGVLLDRRGVPVRFGLMNESSAQDKVCKSADLIGIGPSGQFVSVEVKRPGGVIHPAQHAWAALVTKRGGLGLIVDREGQLP
jgi:hypothetical protein